MKKLTTHNFAKARAYLQRQARPLEQALFRYHFEDGPALDVWQELAAFQNEDGGFGRALEPDLRTPTSSALATGNALRNQAQTDATAAQSQAPEAETNLEQTLEQQRKTWRDPPRDNKHHPHAHL